MQRFVALFLNNAIKKARAPELITEFFVGTVRSAAKLILGEIKNPGKPQYCSVKRI
jgi:hypothetical protein